MSLSNAQYKHNTHGYSALVDGMNIRELYHISFLTFFILSFCIEAVIEQENCFCVRSKLQDHPVPAPWRGQGYIPEDQIAQSPIRAAPEYF